MKYGGWINMKLMYGGKLPILLLLLLLLSGTACAPNVDCTFKMGNIYYEFEELTYFREIDHGVRETPAWIRFNDVTFYVSAATDQTINLYEVNEELRNLDQGARVIWFWGSITNIFFNLSGFPGYNYRITVDDELLLDYISNDSWIRFTASEIGHYEIFHTTPNYDVIMDGVIDLLDLVAVATHYQEDGPDGWIREDVDNNGEIKILDITLVSNYY